ncbi:MAG TPA: acetyl-CoA hydrolase/transferase C-terminal domain-containing protein [Spirillospora sp.]|nr:acetyl-CoA hydrolase/transferase C-terminal domain-containing protein [Spirillospora sp.]
MKWQAKYISAEEAAAKVHSGQRVFLTGNCASPQEFSRALCNRYTEVRHVELVQLLDLGPSKCLTPDMAEHIRVNSMFISANVRDAVNAGLADFTPVRLSDIPLLFSRGVIHIDIAVIQVSPPDEHGFCSYGVEVSVTKTAAESARMIIAEVNPNMPRTHGNSFIHASAIDYMIEVDYPLAEVHPEPANETQIQIAKHIAPLIPDGATMQMGIGGIPNSVLRELTDHRDLGIHTELFSDGIIDLIESGVITCARKTLHPGKAVAGFVVGTRRLHHYVDDNPFFEFHPTEYVNDPFIISRNDRMVSINSAIEVDLTGQVCADSIGPAFYSGVGGQLDFVRGAARSKDGKTIIALPATAKKGTISRIVPQLRPGAGVTTTRNDVHFVATEFGIADLWGRTIRQRVEALVNIAHPNFREDLLRYAHEQNYIPRLYSLS